MKNIYQHCRDVHGVSYKALCAGDPERSSGTNLTQLSSDAVDLYADWLTTLDGTNLSQKTADMYKCCVTKVLQQACSGSLENLKSYKTWIGRGGFLQDLTERLSPATVATYLQALRLFMNFLKTQNANPFCKGANLSKVLIQEAADAFMRWHAAQRKGRQMQRTAVVAESQSLIPSVAKGMQEYTSSSQYK